MSFFTLLLNKKTDFCTQIGISEDNEHYCLVYRLEGEETIIWQRKPFSPTLLIEQQIKSTAKLRIIRPIPYSYIWRKSYNISNKYDETIIYKQVLQTIKQTLPLPLEEIYFDFNVTEIGEQNLSRVAIYALRKTFADPLILNKQTILDCELHCWQRAVHFLQPEKQETETALAYCYQGKTFMFKDNELLFLQQDPQDMLTINPLTLSSEIIKPELYLLALGAALWEA